MQKDLLSLLAARKGHFRLESGHHGDLWLDLDLLFLRPDQLRPFAAELAGRLTKYNLAAVCGPLVGGALLAQMVAAELNVEFYYTERTVPPQAGGLHPVEYRLPDGLRQKLQGKDVAILDDAINAGSAVRATFAALQSCGARPVVIAALLVLGSAATGALADLDLPIESLAHLSSGLWAPSECPLCASRIPLEDRVSL